MVHSMNTVKLYGAPPSSYVRTARMTCVEKGAEHELVVQNPQSPEQKAMHPFGKMPAMTHGDVTLFETSAICRYIDQAFDGPALTPSGATDAAVMEQWISVINCYLYGSMIKNYSLVYIFAGFKGQEPDREKITAGVPAMAEGLQMLDKGYDGKDWLAGDAMSLADLFVAPVVQTVNMFPEGQEAMASCANVKRVFEVMSARDSYKAAHAQLG